MQAPCSMDGLLTLPCSSCTLWFRPSVLGQWHGPPLSTLGLLPLILLLCNCLAAATVSLGPKRVSLLSVEQLGTRTARNEATKRHS